SNNDLAICSETRYWRRPISPGSPWSSSTLSFHPFSGSTRCKSSGASGFRSCHLKVPQQMAVDLL
ncbi:hypothetical protein M407DRAFT_244816, partial [Tulasnella calospora MUT 4182]